MRTAILIAFVAALPATLAASGIVCSLGTQSNTPEALTTGCNSVFAYTNTFDWSTLNPGPLGPMSGPTYQSTTSMYFANGNPSGSQPATNGWVGTSGGETVTTTLGPYNVGGTPYLQLDGNTAWVYTGSGYIPSSFSNTSVQLGFGTIDPSHPVAWSFGETVLADPNGQGPINISFSKPVEGVGFQISTLSVPNFIATLVAYDSYGNVLGTFVLDTNGTNVGGTCTSLFAYPGAPCANAAPFIGITADQLHLGAQLIASIRVSTNAPGFAIGTMDIIETPEPSDALICLAGLVLLIGGYVSQELWRRNHERSGVHQSRAHPETGGQQQQTAHDHSPLA